MCEPVKDSGWGLVVPLKLAAAGLSMALLVAFVHVLAVVFAVVALPFVAYVAHRVRVLTRPAAAPVRAAVTASPRVALPARVPLAIEAPRVRMVPGMVMRGKVER